MLAITKGKNKGGLGVLHLMERTDATALTAVRPVSAEACAITNRIYSNCNAQPCSKGNIEAYSHNESSINRNALQVSLAAFLDKPLQSADADD